MNYLYKAMSFIPNMFVYLRGVTLFHRKQYDSAISAFEKCLNHPSFNDESIFSYYGQSLCAVGKHEEACLYLVKASQLYEALGWQFSNAHNYSLASNTIAALKHISTYTDIEIDQSLIHVKPTMKDN
jgi:tetratricopeptide (TPR) repeat protein